jgi:hypothetical protein
MVDLVSGPLIEIARAMREKRLTAQELVGNREARALR